MLGFILILFLLDGHVNWEVRATLAVTFLGIFLWITEMLSFGHTSIVILVMYIIFQVADLELILSGFATGAVFLIIGGMMFANAVNSTPLANRVVYFILKYTGNSPNSLLFGIILIPQILAIFIPTAAVRVSLILPVILSLISILQIHNEVGLKKQMMLAVSYGGTISGIGLLPAAVSNVIVVELLYFYTGTIISYFDWFLYTFPIWFLSIPITWYVVKQSSSTEDLHLDNVKKETIQQITKLGPLSREELKCIIILVFTVMLWTTQPLHGLHPSVVTLLSAAVMGMPFIGVTEWKVISKINIDTVLLVGTTMSIGIVMIETKSVDYLSSILFTDVSLAIISVPILSIILLAVFVQLFHLGVSIVSTVVVTLVPVAINLALQVGADPVLFVMTTGVASLCGFILVIESVPNIMAYSTGLITQRDFIKPGVILTVISTILLIVVAAIWWNFLGLY